MAGVTMGRRLDRLRDLERAVKVQIELEELAESRGRAAADPCAAYPTTDSVPAPDEGQPRGRTSIVRVPLEHVSTPVMRAWARQNRYAVSARGPIDDFIVGAFIEAHQ
jgi:hypothetical protein